MRVVFHRLAERELADAIAYYEQESQGLGLAFLTEVEGCAERIIANPAAGSPILGSVRRRLIKRFPYALLYSISNLEIRILAVMNLKRRPNYWIGRK